MEKSYEKSLKYSKDYRLKKWELALLLAICAAICAVLWANTGSRKLSDKVIRLHVIAESDGEYDQMVKLAVRDSVLELLEPALAEAESREGAQEVIRGKLPEIEAAAVETMRAYGSDAGVFTEIGVEAYPTRHYDGFSLPAGDYVSLRVTLGEGEGRNWWCVVFPPLCMAAAEGPTIPASDLDDDDIGLITGEDGGYIIKFRIIEIIEMIKQGLAGSDPAEASAPDESLPVDERVISGAVSR